MLEDVCSWMKCFHSLFINKTVLLNPNQHIVKSLSQVIKEPQCNKMCISKRKISSCHVLVISPFSPDVQFHCHWSLCIVRFPISKSCNLMENVHKKVKKVKQRDIKHFQVGPLKSFKRIKLSTDTFNSVAVLQNNRQSPQFLQYSCSCLFLNWMRLDI